MLRIRVPATSANMGPGFDCIGMAFQLYNTLWVEERPGETLVIESDTPGIAKDERNLIYATIQWYYRETGQGEAPRGLYLRQRDEIPMTRGLGSSAACIVAGLLAANELSRLCLPREQLIDMAARIEGHPDNSTPAFTGGVVLGAMQEGRLQFIRLEPMRGLEYAVMIPEFSLSTEKARAVLPETYTRQDAVYNISRAALLAAAIMTGDMEKLSVAMDDRIHQPYRKAIVPGMAEIFEEARALGAKGVFLSGAGPTLIAVTENAEALCTRLQPYLEARPERWGIRRLAPDTAGAQVTVE